MEDSEALTQIVAIMKSLDPDSQHRVLASVSTFFGVAHPPQRFSEISPDIKNLQVGRSPSFSEDRTMSPKEFVRDKQPSTDVERVACLAYYLAHFRSTPHFKTVDISSLNIEAAQPKFSNAAVAVDNARARGFLVASTKGNKQLSAVGEKYVELLPDRDAAKSSMLNVRARRPQKKTK
ncbi:hypothetical protein HDC36_003881 [Xanthomonas sp. JAI131]|uniref:hypothetical protein n=1 Tax=Xanthomonas sp. JAI131 TaxID=2723067 RepID=UPI0015CE3F44|nr:hypothetical protein [Xanthomonas sp. JAI131]NYF22405.1 hypothetical protein [Xanthomonas sp. JAI131]